jgi:Tn3 transposase DDE domain
VAALPRPLHPGLNLPTRPEQYLQRLEAGLTSGLAALAEAVATGTVAVEDGELRLPRRKPAPRDPRVDPARQALVIGNAQLPQVIIEIDHLTRFSWTLLGRPARSERELVTLYAGLIGLGSDLSAAELVRMVPAPAADSLGQMFLRIEADGRLRTANDLVLRFMRGHRIADFWGRGLFASADMMSLEATRYLWAAQLDPGGGPTRSYAHVLGVTGRFVKNCTLSRPGGGQSVCKQALEGPTSVLPQAGRLPRAPGTARDYPSTGWMPFSSHQARRAFSIAQFSNAYHFSSMPRACSNALKWPYAPLRRKKPATVSYSSDNS